MPGKEHVSFICIGGLVRCWPKFAKGGVGVQMGSGGVAANFAARHGHGRFRLTLV